VVKNVKIPIRTCIGCDTKKPKKEMLRIVISPDGDCGIDPSGKKSGRGFYLCYQMECLNNAIKRKKFDKYMDKENSLDLINELKEIFQKGNV